jgi:hypothetical protein
MIAKCIKEKNWPGPGGYDDSAAYIDILESYRQRATEAVEQ